MKKKIRTIIFCIACIGLAWSGFKLASYGYQTYVTWHNVRELAKLVNDADDRISIQDGDESVAETTSKTGERSEKLLKRYQKLYEMNSDFGGWLKVEGTSIDNPVMYTPTDSEHYLRLNFNGEYDIAGMLFIDGRCDITEKNRSENVIIYGHRMNNDTMFGPLRKFKKDAFFNENRTIYFDTLYGTGEYEIFAVILSEAYDENDDTFKYYDYIDAYNEDDFNLIMEDLRALAIQYDEEAAPEYGDQLLTLSTCDYYKEDGRLAVIAKRVNYPDP